MARSVRRISSVRRIKSARIATAAVMAGVHFPVAERPCMHEQFPRSHFWRRLHFPQLRDLLLRAKHLFVAAIDMFGAEPIPKKRASYSITTGHHFGSERRRASASIKITETLKRPHGAERKKSPAREIWPAFVVHPAGVELVPAAGMLAVRSNERECLLLALSVISKRANPCPVLGETDCLQPKLACANKLLADDNKRFQKVAPILLPNPGLISSHRVSGPNLLTRFCMHFRH